MVKSGIMVLCVLIVIFAGCAAQKPVLPEKATGQIKGDIKEGLATLTIVDQQIEQEVVVIDAVTFDYPGFIVVSKGTEILGSSDIYPAGVYTLVGVKIANYEKGDLLVARLYYDNGNTQLDVQEDLLAANNGEVIASGFSVLG